MNSYINPLTNQTTQSLVEELNKSYKINPDYFNRFNGFFKFFYKLSKLKYFEFQKLRFACLLAKRS